MRKNLACGRRAERYALRCADGWVLDPTDEDGELRPGPRCHLLVPGLPLLSADANMTLANEPDGSDEQRAQTATLEICETAPGRHTMFAARDVDAGAELCWDYGVGYGPRDGYTADR